MIIYIINRPIIQGLVMNVLLLVNGYFFPNLINGHLIAFKTCWHCTVAMMCLQTTERKLVFLQPPSTFLEPSWWTQSLAPWTQYGVVPLATSSDQITSSLVSEVFSLMCFSQDLMMICGEGFRNHQQRIKHTSHQALYPCTPIMSNALHYLYHSAFIEHS